MDKTASYVNYESPDQLDWVLKIFNKTFLFLKKSNFRGEGQK